ncbi:MAG: integrase arm-type DNA-binding domain-containing protein [Opitutaceae bacterium]
MRIHFTTEVLQSLAARPSPRRRRLSDRSQKGLVLDLTPSGAYFGFRYSFAGRQRLIALGKLGEVDVDKARLLASELGHQLIDGRDPASTQPTSSAAPTLQRFYAERYLPHIRTYKTTDTNDSNYFENHLLPFFGDQPMSSITRNEVSRFVGSKIAEGLKPGSINRYIVALRFAFNLALQWEVPGIKKNPLQRYPLLKENNLISRFLTPEETARLKSALA